MFPAKNLDLKIPDSQTTDLADDAMDQLSNSGLFSNQLERQKVTAAANAIAGTVQVTRSTVQSLQDADRKRYVFSDDVWKTERSNIEKVVVTDLAPYQTSYGNLALLRTNYDVLTQHFVEYLQDLESFFDPAKHLITREGLRQILAKERYTESLLVTYSKALSDQMAQLKSLSEKLRASTNRAVTPSGGQAQDASSKWQRTRPSVSRACRTFFSSLAAYHLELVAASQISARPSRTLQSPLSGFREQGESRVHLSRISRSLDRAGPLIVDFNAVPTGFDRHPCPVTDFCQVYAPRFARKYPAFRRAVDIPQNRPGGMV